MKKSIFRVMLAAVCLLIFSSSYAMSSDIRKAPELEKVSSYNYKKIKISWQEVKGADGYQIYRAPSSDGKFRRIATIAGGGKTSYIDSGRITGKRYWYKVRAYEKNSKKTVYSSFSEVRSAYARPVKVRNLTAEWQPKGGYRLKWKASKGADGYEVAVRQKGDTKWRKGWYYKYGPTYEETIFVGDIDISGTSAFVGAGNCDYEFKVRAYSIEGGKKVYGLYSDVFRPREKVTADELKAAAENYIRQKYPDCRLAEAAGRTPENSGWGPTWPKSFSRYMSAEMILDLYLAEALDFYAENFWNVSAGGIPAGSIYVRENDNCYSVWWIA